MSLSIACLVRISDFLSAISTLAQETLVAIELVPGASTWASFSNWSYCGQLSSEWKNLGVRNCGVLCKICLARRSRWLWHSLLKRAQVHGALEVVVLTWQANNASSRSLVIPFSPWQLVLISEFVHVFCSILRLQQVTQSTHLINWRCSMSFFRPRYDTKCSDKFDWSISKYWGTKSFSILFIFWLKRMSRMNLSSKDRPTDIPYDIFWYLSMSWASN